MFSFIKNRHINTKKQRKIKGHERTTTPPANSVTERVTDLDDSSSSLTVTPLSASLSSLPQAHSKNLNASLTQLSPTHTRRPSLTHGDFDHLLVQSRGWAYDPSESETKPHHERDHNKAMASKDFDRYIFAEPR